VHNEIAKNTLHFPSAKDLISSTRGTTPFDKQSYINVTTIGDHVRYVIPNKMRDYKFDILAICEGQKIASISDFLYERYFIFRNNSQIVKQMLYFGTLSLFYNLIDVNANFYFIIPQLRGQYSLRRETRA